MRKFTTQQKDIRRRIVRLLYESGHSHIGSCLSAADIIEVVYQVKKKDERFVLSSGHAAFALYAVLEKNSLIDPEVIKTLHIHPDRNSRWGIDVSTGSLGQGLPIAVGMALADRTKRVFCLVSDGECSEGSIWESLRLICENRLDNLITVINANGWGAYKAVSPSSLVRQIRGFGFKVAEVEGHDIKKLKTLLDVREKLGRVVFVRTTVEQFPFLKGQNAHYYVMNEHDYAEAMEELR